MMMMMMMVGSGWMGSFFVGERCVCLNGVVCDDYFLKEVVWFSDVYWVFSYGIVKKCFVRRLEKFDMFLFSVIVEFMDAILCQN